MVDRFLLLTETQEILIVLASILSIVIWLKSEFHWQRNTRLFCGIIAIIGSYGINLIITSYVATEANAKYGRQSKALIDAVTTELEAGNKDKVLAALHNMQASYKPSGKRPDLYGTKVQKTINELQSKSENQ